MKIKLLKSYIIKINVKRLLLKKKLFDYLVNRDILKLASMNNSFFISKKLDKIVKLEHNILELNYLKESPFPIVNSYIVSILEEDNLYLWFYNKKDKKHYIPEALILFRFLNKEHRDGLFIFQDSITKIIIIKDSCLVGSFVKNKLSNFDIKLIEEEFSIKDGQKYFFNTKEYKYLLEEAFNNLKISDFLQVLNLSIDFKSLINRGLVNLSLPLLVSSILVIISLSGYYFYIQDKYDKLYKIYQTKQKSVSKIKDKVLKFEESVELFNSINKEFTYSNKTVALFAITKEVKEHNMTLFYIRMSEENIEFEIRTKNSSKIPQFTEKLFSLDIFSSVKNSSTQNLTAGKVKATMHAILKER